MIVIPEYDIVAVFTGWNIYDVPALHSYKAMNKVINSVIPEKHLILKYSFCFYTFLCSLVLDSPHQKESITLATITLAEKN